MTENTAPATEEFSFDDWFGDARLPERSTDVIVRADLVARLEALQRRIEEAPAYDETSLGEESLEDQYAALLEEFLASRVTLYMRAVPHEEQRQLRDSLGPQLPTNASDKKKQERLRLLGATTLAASLVGIARGDGPRQVANFTAADIIQLEEKLGQAQMSKVNAAFAAACNELPQVSADFLPRSSGKGNTQE